MSMSKQLQDFNLNFVQETMREWSNVAQSYEHETEKIYTKLRSYLTFHQFRLNDQQKCEIREMLSQELDELEKVNFIAFLISNQSLITAITNVVITIIFLRSLTFEYRL